MPVNYLHLRNAPRFTLKTSFIGLANVTTIKLSNNLSSRCPVSGTSFVNNTPGRSGVAICVETQGHVPLEFSLLFFMDF